MGTCKMDSASIKGLMVFILTAIGTTAVPHLLMKQQNIWLTWANKTHNPNFCLSLASAQEPFKTCLIGIPLSVNESIEMLTGLYNVSVWNNCNCTGKPDACLAHLPFNNASCRLAFQ